MNNVIIKDKIVIENLIYEIRRKQVMLDSEISETKWHDYIYKKIVTHYSIGLSISVFIKLKFFRRVWKIQERRILC